MFDRYQIVLGHYIFCTHYHGGQFSDLYAKMCRIGKYFSLSCLWTDSDLENEENEIAKEVYENLKKKHGF